MFSICRQTHPATGIEHSVSCCFFNNDETCLVTAGANIIKVFRLVPEGHTKEVNAAGQPIPPKMKLECLASYTLWGNVMSIAAVKCPSAGRDLLLLSFREAKLSVVQYDPQINNLVTLSMHYFEEDDMKGGWTTHPHIPWIRVDPEFRCAVMLLYGKKLAVLPFRKDLTSEDGDPLEAKPLSDSKKIQPQQQITRSPTLASYVIVLKELDEKIDNILDIQFLYGYYEPTLLLLYEPVRTFAGRIAVRSDTCAMAGVSLNMSARVHPVIWSTGGLPFDCLQAVPIEKPLGGCLILAVNSLIYLNQSVPPYGVSLNSIASHTTNFPLRVQEGACITLDGAQVAPLGETRLALALRGGQLYVLTLLADSVRSVRSFHLDRAAASVLTSCMCVIEEDFLFLGSRLGNSLLLRVTERENRMLLSVDKPLEATIDLTLSEAEQQAAASKEAAAQTQNNQSTEPAKRRRLDTLSDCVATNVIEISDKDELEVYGSDIRTSTQLTSYVFEVCDSLLNICPIGAVSMGEVQLLAEGETGDAAEGRALELVACSGRGKNGALTVLQRSVRPQLLTSFELPGCIDMWSVIGDPGEVVRDAHKDMEGTHAYLLLTQADATMVLQTGQEINEVDNSGFSTSAPTVFAGNLGNNKYMVQVTTSLIRLVRNGVMLQSIALEWTARSASVADPYLCVLSTCGRALVLALRELRPRDPTSARLAPTRQAVPPRPRLLRAAPYRDLSGLFGPPDENIQIKGEFTGKKKGKSVKAEGFKPDTVYEVNDEDELLYGGDQTPASMASIMLAEQSKNPGLPKRMSRWWKRYLADVKPTYWLFVVRDNGNLEIYSLPEMKLSFLVRDVCAGHKILADSLESVPIPVNPEEEEEFISAHSANAEKLQEILVVGLGHKGGRVLMLLKCDNDQLMIYQAYKYPRGNLKMRFSRMAVSFPFGYKSEVVSCPDDSYEASALREGVRQLRYFGNVGGYSGVFVCGRTPLLLLLGARGELRVHPLSTSAPVASMASFNNANCPQGLLYFNAQGSLRIAVLPTHLSYEAAWAVRKVPLRETPHFVTYHVESRTYCLVTSLATPTNSYYKFNGEDKEKSTENKGDRFPYPTMERFAVMLFSPVSWEVIPNTRIEFDEWEHVTCLKNVSLSYEGTRSGLRGYIAIGTNYNYGEDITSRGRILIYDIIDVVPEPGQPLTKNKFKEIYAKEQKGPVTALTQVLGFLISAVGQKIYIWQLKDNDLVGVAFIDTQIYVHRMLAVKNLILVADVYKSVSLLRYQDKQRTLSLVSRDLRTAQIYDMEFMVDNTTLGFLVSESEGNLALFMYQPQARESYGGQRLIRKCDYHVGQPVHAMFRLAARSLSNAPPTRHVTMFTTLDGGLGYVLPVSEQVYRRLLMLQNVCNNYCCHIAGLNPRAHRYTVYTVYRVQHSCCTATLDGGLGYVLPVSEQVYRRLLMLQNVCNNYCCHIAGLNPRAHRYTVYTVYRVQHSCCTATLDGGLGYVLPVSEQVYRRLLMLQNVCNNYCCHIAGLNPRAHRYTVYTVYRVQHSCCTATLDGGLGYVLPVSEQVYRRLLMLQNVCNNYCCHIAGLNPRAHRTYKSARRGLGSAPARGILDGDLIALYCSMPLADQHDIAKKIGTKVEEIMADLFEIDRLTAHF